MFLPLKAIGTSNRAFSRQKLIACIGPLPCGVSKQAARLLFSCEHGTQIFGFFLPYWVDKYVS